MSVEFLYIVGDDDFMLSGLKGRRVWKQRRGMPVRPHAQQNQIKLRNGRG